MRVDVLELFLEECCPPGLVRVFDSFPTGGFSVYDPHKKADKRAEWKAANPKAVNDSARLYRENAKIVHPGRGAEYARRYRAKKKAAAASTETS